MGLAIHLQLSDEPDSASPHDDPDPHDVQRYDRLRDDTKRRPPELITLLGAVTAGSTVEVHGVSRVVAFVPAAGSRTDMTAELLGKDGDVLASAPVFGQVLHAEVRLRRRGWRPRRTHPAVPVPGHPGRRGSRRSPAHPLCRKRGVAPRGVSIAAKSRDARSESERTAGSTSPGNGRRPGR